MVAPYPEFFNDVFGPVMQPGSSSHTAGPCRLGYLAGCLLGEPLARVRVELDEHGSFAGTSGIMAEDKAMLAGVLGYLPDDVRLFRSYELAEEAGVSVEFVLGTIGESGHPNAIKFALTGRSGTVVELVGESTGGGMVRTVAIDGFPYRTIGDAWVVLLEDSRETLCAAQISRFAAVLPEVLDKQTLRDPERGVLHAFALAEEPCVERLRELIAAQRPRVALLRPLLPVVSWPDRRPQLFDTMTRWRELAEERGEPLWETAVQYEMDASGWTRAQVLERMRALAQIMRRQTRAVYAERTPSGEATEAATTAAGVPLTSPFKPDFAGRWARHEGTPEQVTDGVTARTIRYAYGAGAGIPGVENVPGPMGGGGGYIYAALSAVLEGRQADAAADPDHAAAPDPTQAVSSECAASATRALGDEDLLHGLFVAAGVGAIAFTRSEPTGEVLGCTGEAGVCGAMAAAAIVAMVGGSPQAAEDAASLALQALMGLPCDPMPGGLSQPCRSRILAATCMAHVFADLALAGHAAVLPLHEALDVADTLGRALPPELKCTSEGGCCLAPAAQAQRAAYQRWCDESRPEDRPPGNLI